MQRARDALLGGALVDAAAGGGSRPPAGVRDGRAAVGVLPAAVGEPARAWPDEALDDHALARVDDCSGAEVDDGALARVDGVAAPAPVAGDAGHAPADDEVAGTHADPVADPTPTNDPTLTEDDVARVLLESFAGADAPVGVFAWPGGALRWGNAALDHLGDGTEGARSLVDLLDEWSQAHFLVRAAPELLRTGRWQGRLGLVDPRAGTEPVRATLTAHRRGGGEIDAVCLVAESLRAEEAALTESLVSALVEHVSDLILVVDVDGRVAFASRAAGELLEVEGPDPVDLRSLIHEDDRPASLVELARTGVGVEAAPTRLRLLARDGSWRHLDAVITDLTSNPAIEGLVVNARDVTEDVVARRAVSRAFTDEQTGLPNRVCLLDHLEGRVGDEAGGPALLVVGLDRLAPLIDDRGQAATDRLLEDVAGRIVEGAPPDALVARLRAGEFAVVLSGATDPDDLRRCSEDLRAAVAVPVWSDGAAVRLEASVGVAVAQAGEVPDALLARADRALRRAQADGRGGVVLDDGGTGVVVLGPGLDRRLDALLHGDALRIRYQPIVELRGRRPVAVEALLRVRGEGGELLSPAAFVEAAESSGLIARLGVAVLRAACAELVGAGLDLDVSVNVSPRQVGDPGFAPSVLDVLQATGLPPGRLSLEITEGAFLGRDDAGEHNIVRLREAGVRVGLDEFGGDTSLGYLRRFPLDFVKIDRSLIAGLGENYVDGTIVRAVVDLGRKLGLTPIAVGVESEEQRVRLRELGCEQGQGYLFAPAVAGQDLAAFPGPVGP